VGLERFLNRFILGSADEFRNELIQRCSQDALVELGPQAGSNPLYDTLAGCETSQLLSETALV
jgi:hypothetical protein